MGCDLIKGEWWAIHAVTLSSGSTEGNIGYDLLVGSLGDTLRETDETNWIIFLFIYLKSDLGLVTHLFTLLFF